MSSGGIIGGMIGIERKMRRRRKIQGEEREKSKRWRGTVVRRKEARGEEDDEGESWVSNKRQEKDKMERTREKSDRKKVEM